MFNFKNVVVAQFIGRILLVLFSAGLLFLSFPNYNLSFLAWIGFVPVLTFLKNLTTKKEAFFWGLLLGILTNIGLLYWIVPTFITAGESWMVGAGCLLLLSTYLGLYYAIFFWLVRDVVVGFIVRRHSALDDGVRPVNHHNYSVVAHLGGLFIPGFVWVALEYLRTYLLSGFPWVLLGYTQWNFLPIIQISEFTGVYGVSFLVVIVNFMIAEWLSVVRERSKILHSFSDGVARVRWTNNITVAVIFLICLTFGFYKLSQQPDKNKPSFKTVILQGNIDQYKKWDKQYEQEIVDAYTGLVKSSVVEKPDLVVWPETSVPGYLCYDKQLWNWVGELVKETGCYHLVGSAHYKEGKNYNSSFLVSPKQDLIAEYSKTHLVPFGEYVPLQNVLSKYVKTLNELGGVTPGKDFTVMDTPFARLSSNICFESIFPDLVRRFAKDGAEVIVNQTNDSWYLNTSAPYQHFVVNVFRAVENRRYVVRAANSGISAIIDSSGRVQTKTKLFQYKYLAGRVSPSNETTFYTKYGDIFALLSVLISIIFIGVIIYRQFLRKS